MSDESMRNRVNDRVTETTKTLKTFLIVGGILAIIVGLLVLLWPGQSAVVATMILAVYAVVAGLVYIASAVTGSDLRASARWGMGLAGVVFLIAGVIAFMNPALSAASFVTIVTIFIGVAWIFEGIAALTTLADAPSKGWAIFFAIVSILAGIALLMTPLFGGILLITWIGASLLVIGIFQVIRGIQVGK